MKDLKVPWTHYCDQMPQLTFCGKAFAMCTDIQLSKHVSATLYTLLAASESSSGTCGTLSATSWEAVTGVLPAAAILVRLAPAALLLADDTASAGLAAKLAAAALPFDVLLIDVLANNCRNTAGVTLASTNNLKTCIQRTSIVHSVA